MVVGGLAVVAHGFVRFTADLYLILALDEQNLTRAVRALKLLDYRPRVPVPFEEFIDPARRREWAEQKGMTVFSLFSPAHPSTEVNLFVDMPLEYERLRANAVNLEIAPGVLATFCGLDDLIALKTIAGRPRDLQDIEQLRSLGDGGSA